MSKRSKPLLILEYMAFANTILLIILSGFLGGDPSGMKAGRYYLCANGYMTEVSKLVYYFLNTDKWIMIITLPLVADLIYQNGRKREELNKPKGTKPNPSSPS